MDDFFIYPQAQRLDEIKQEIASLARFRHALHKDAQEALDGLLDRSQTHFPLASAAERLSPFEFLLLSMLIEQSKLIRRLADQLAEISAGAEDGPSKPPADMHADGT